MEKKDIYKGQYNLRVYGIWIPDDENVLISKESRFGRKMIKFPGGGVKFGEGLEEAIQREWMEELRLEMIVDKLFYINSFAQPSAFDKSEMLLSVYYLINSKISNYSIVSQEADQEFFWQKIDQIDPAKFTFPVDKIVAEMLSNGFIG